MFGREPDQLRQFIAFFESIRRTQRARLVHRCVATCHPQGLGSLAMNTHAVAERRRTAQVCRCEHGWAPGPMEQRHHPEVFRLLSRDLSHVYVGGQRWLDGKLAELHDGRASGLVVEDGAGRVVGSAIETPKGSRRTKLSTIYVKPVYRHNRIGTSMMRSLISSWSTRDVEYASVTVASSRVRTIQPLLTTWGFSLVALIPERYGDGRDEFVFTWQPAG